MHKHKTGIMVGKSVIQVIARQLGEGNFALSKMIRNERRQLGNSAGLLSMSE